jgi:hypothetical protein
MKRRPMAVQRGVYSSQGGRDGLRGACVSIMRPYFHKVSR